MSMMQDPYRPELITARLHLVIPSKADFYSKPCPIDADYAWAIFGGLGLDAAYEKFLQLPDSYAEAFAWMSPSVFEYYFPVMDRYLRCVDLSSSEEGWDELSEAWILGCWVFFQFGREYGPLPPAYVIQEIEDVSRFVQSHLYRYSKEADERQRIAAKWGEVDQTIRDLAR
jgi:hypothetical protein